MLAGCAGPAPRVASAPAAAADQRPPVRLQAPRVSPDGTTILFAFKYGSLPHNLAVMPSDPAQARISTLEAPPTMAWTDPAWSPDQRHFAAISYCRGGNCYEGAEGHHVWQFTVRPGPDNLQRITLDDGEVRRAEPFFGRSVDDIHWVFSSSWVYERVRWGLHDRFRACAEGRRGKVLFPDDPEILPIRRPDPGKLNSAPITKSKKFAFSALSPARVFGHDAVLRGTGTPWDAAARAGHNGHQEPARATGNLCVSATHRRGSTDPQQNSIRHRPPSAIRGCGARQAPQDHDIRPGSRRGAGKEVRS